MSLSSAREKDKLAERRGTNGSLSFEEVNEGLSHVFYHFKAKWLKSVHDKEIHNSL